MHCAFVPIIRANTMNRDNVLLQLRLISRLSSGIFLYIVINSKHHKSLFKNWGWNESFIIYLRLPFFAGLEARDARRWLRMDFARWNHRLLRDNGQLVERPRWRVFAFSAVTDSRWFNHRQEPRHGCREWDQRLGTGMLFLLKICCLHLSYYNAWRKVARD